MKKTISPRDKQVSIFAIIVLMGLGLGKLDRLTQPGNRNYTFVVVLALLFLGFAFGRLTSDQPVGKKNGKK